MVNSVECYLQINEAYINDRDIFWSIVWSVKSVKMIGYREQTNLFREIYWKPYHWPLFHAWLFEWNNHQCFKIILCQLKKYIAFSSKFTFTLPNPYPTVALSSISKPVIRKVRRNRMANTITWCYAIKTIFMRMIEKCGIKLKPLNLTLRRRIMTLEIR